MDFEKEGELSLAVFVREMSMLMKMNLRKRDLKSIFERMTEGEFVTKRSLTAALATK